ncbi:efflux transporter outer membrane subunit [Caulobacter soli]|uniref:efflux transporter outer membrane subunit n=1 Tax=Caulobacter soli TaxID=2708539 RepID=UPI0013EB3212|nr:efflux transporter outer membrane subunit [Caulobacter soli]
MRSPVLTAVTLVGALLASACAAPDLGPKPVVKVVGQQQLFTGPVADWPTEDWWTGYGDPQLTGLIATGLQDAPTIAVAQARLRRASALVGLAGAAQQPSVSANAAAAESKPSYNTGLPTPAALHGWNDTGRATLDFSYELDLWGKTRASIAAATSEEAAAKADAAAARLIVSTSIAAAYADLARLFADRDVLASTVGVREQTLALVRRRTEGGYDSEAELRQAQVGPPLARAELEAVDEQIALTRLRLASLMGQTPDRAASIARPQVTALRSLGLPADLPTALIARRPDLVAARWRAEAASERIDVAHAAFYPNVNLVGLIGVQSLGIGNLADAGSNLGSAGAVLGLPIFDGGRRQAGFKVARADYDAAIGAYDGTLNQALEEMADAVTSQRALEQRLADSREAEEAATSGWRLAKRRYTGGATDFTAVLVAEGRMLATRRAVSTLEARRFILDLALVRALGGGWREGQGG